MLCSLHISAVLPAQETDASVSVSAEQESRRIDEHDIYLNIDDAEPAQAQQMEEPSAVWLFVRMIFVLVLVIACIYVVVFFLKKGLQPGSESDPYLRRAASLSLGQGKSVQIVTLGDDAYILGVCDNAISVIGKVEDKDLVSAMNLHAEKTAVSKTPLDFAAMLAKFTGVKKTESVSDAALSAKLFIRSKRERLHNSAHTDSSDSETKE